MIKPVLSIEDKIEKLQQELCDQQPFQVGDTVFAVGYKREIKETKVKRLTYNGCGFIVTELGGKVFNVRCQSTLFATRQEAENAEAAELVKEYAEKVATIELRIADYHHSLAKLKNQYETACYKLDGV